MPMKKVHCKVCREAIKGEDFPARMAKLRSHYKDRHPKKWREAVRRGARKRAKRR